MRITRPLLIAYLFFFSYGCSEEQPYEPEKKYVSVWPEDTEHVRIEADLTHGNFTLKSDNQEIATAIIRDDKTSVCVIAHKSGATMIRLIDTDKDQMLCEISVSVKYFGSSRIIDWGIPSEGYPGYPEVIVKAKDIEIQKKIEDELQVEGRSFIGTTYKFNSETNKFTMKTLSGIDHEGSYEWDITSLTLRYDDRVERYGFKLATGMRYGYFIQADKTEKYQLKYPDAGITEVKVKHVWQDKGIFEMGGLTF